MLFTCVKNLKAAPLERYLTSAATARSRRMSPVLSSTLPGSELHLDQIRWKHSSTQVKRLFRRNPSRLRVEERMGVDRTPAPLDRPQFPPILQPELLPNGWSAPPEPDVQVPEYPFKIARTKNKPNNAVGFLPVYTKYRKDGTKTTTQIRKVTGDRDLFLSELRSVLNLPPPKNNNPRDDTIRIRVGGTIEVDGNHCRAVKQWLAGLGF